MKKEKTEFRNVIKQQEEITYATRQMIPDLINLWMEAFGDDKEYVDFYFTNRFAEESVLVYLLDGRPVSMISMLPAYLHTNTQVHLGQAAVRFQIRYIYAVATFTFCRGRGYARKLIEEGHRRLQIPFILEPATVSLADYYRRMGFCDAFFVSEHKLAIGEMGSDNDIAFHAAELSQISVWNRPKEQGMTVSLTGTSQRYWLLTVTPKEYKKIRDRYFLGTGYVEWDEEAIAYILLENDYCGGFTYKVFHDDTEDILMYRMEDNCIKIIETTLSDEDILGVLMKLRLTPDSVIVRRPVTKASEMRNFGMMLGDAAVKDGYLNLTLE